MSYSGNGSGSGSISTSSDVALSSPTNGQGLTYNSSIAKWQNSTLPTALITSVNSYTGAVVLAKSDVGLGSVDNTSDTAKPISLLTQTALNAKAPLASPTFTGTPTAPTATVGDNSTKIATTAFVIANAGSSGSGMTQTTADTRYVAKGSLVINVKDYGAVGNGSTDDTSAIQAALTAGGNIYFPPGTYITSATLDASGAPAPTIFGAGRYKTIIQRNGNFVLMKCNGTATFSGHSQGLVLRDIQLSGASFTGALLEMVYTDNSLIQSCAFSGSNGRAIDAVEMWDTRIENNNFELNGDTSGTAVVEFRNSRATSGFGYSADNSNQIFFRGNRIESSIGTAFSVSVGTSNTNSPNGFFITDNKFESVNITNGPVFNIGAGSVGVHIKNVFISLNSFKSGYSTAVVAMNLAPAYNWSIRDVLIADGSTATVSTGVNIYADGPGIVENVNGQYNTAPTSGQHITYLGGGPFYNKNNWAINATSETLTSNSFFMSDVRATTAQSYSTSVTFSRGDGNRIVECTSASATTLTIPSDATSGYAWPIGIDIIIYQIGAGLVTIAAGSGVTLVGATTTGAQYGRRILHQRSLNSWICS